MPQADPMSSEAFAESLQAISDKLAESVPKFASKQAAEAWYEANKTIETDAWAKAITQRDRTILEAAAERVCQTCKKKCDLRAYRGYRCHLQIAILKPLNKGGI